MSRFIQTLVNQMCLGTMADRHVLTMFANVAQRLHSFATSVIINKIQLSTLFLSCRTENYISHRVELELKVQIHPSNKRIISAHPSNKRIILAPKDLNRTLRGYIVVNLLLCFNGPSYIAIRRGVQKNLYSNVILGLDFLCQHQKITFKHGEPLPEISVDNNIHQFCTLKAAEIEEVSVFPYILPSHKPIAVKSRHFNQEDQSFMNKFRNCFLKV